MSHVLNLIRAFQSLQSRRFEAQRGLTEATPWTQNILAQGQSKAHGDSKLYTIIAGALAGLNLKKLGILVPY